MLLFTWISISIVCPEKISPQTKVDISVSRLFLLAKERELTLLEQMERDIAQLNDKGLQIAYNLALFIASPNKYKQRFVDNFPEDSDGIMNYLYDQIELQQLTPSFLYSFGSLGAIAEEGNTTAIKKLFNGYPHSDGVVAEAFCSSMNNLVYKQTTKTLLSLSELSEHDRTIIYGCFENQGPGGISGLKTYLRGLKKNSSKIELKVIEEIDRLN
jgi:hypothetical protein